MHDLPIMLSRCPNFTKGQIDTDRPIPVVPKSHDRVLTDKELTDYKDRRVRFLSWLFQFGKHPGKAEGSSPYTVYSTAYRTARFDLWLWEERGGYKHPPEAYMQHLAFSDKSQTSKGKAQEALKHY